eukprot:gene1770-33186_t
MHQVGGAAQKQQGSGTVHRQLGSTIRLTTVSALYHEARVSTATPPLTQPDLCMFYHPGLHDTTYPWSPTLKHLTGVPCVFTSFDRDDYDEVLEKAKYFGSPTFHGPAPFPSPWASGSKLKDNFLRRSNSFWIGFDKLGDPTLQLQNMMMEMMANLPGVDAPLDVARIKEARGRLAQMMANRRLD